MVAPIVAAKAAQGAKNALSGDIWTRTTYREVGKGKDKRLVESTVRVNTGSALAGAGALGVLGVGLGVTAFMLGVKAKPVTRTEDWGYWVWPSDGTYASKLLPEDKRGSAPTRTIIIKEAYTTQKSVEVPVYEEVCVMWDVIDGRHVCVEYDKVQIGTNIVWKDVFIPAVTESETATWLTTEAKKKLSFDVIARPTLAEALGDAVKEFTSIPFDYACTPFVAAKISMDNTIQDFKEWLGLP